MTQSSEEHLVEHYNKLGDFRSDFRNANLFRLVATLVKGKSVVDIGCGAGFFLGLLKEQGKEVLGIEPNQGMRDLCSKANPDVTTILGSAEEVDTLLGKPVDTVTMLDVLEHIEKDVDQVKKVYAVLKEGGEFVIVVPAHPFLYGIRDIQMGHYRRYTKKALCELLTSNGFTIQYIRHWNVLGLIPYIVSEKILHKPLKVGLREHTEGGLLGNLVRRCLHQWFKVVENNVNFGVGLSIICVAKKKLD